MLNLPNLITLFRLLLVPVFIWLLWHQSYAGGLVIFLLAGLSDALDGYLARRLNQITELGATLDPLADKLIILSALVVLAWLHQLPAWLLLVLLLRDGLIVGGAFAYRLMAGNLQIKPSFLGKLHTFVAFTTICLVLGNAAMLLDDGAWLPWLFYLLLGSAVISGAGYIWVWSRKTRQFLEYRKT